MKNIAIIPARSGSKGLKDKNIKLFCGKPLLAYSIEAAISSGKYDVIHVSTDSQKYAEIAGKYGADVRFLRSMDMASDTADSWDVIREVLDRYNKEGLEFETFTLLQPTSPLRNGADIKNAFDILIKKKANAVISVCEADHPPAFFHILPEDGNMSVFGSGDDKKKRRQDYSAHYRINGAIYLLKTSYFLENHKNIFREKAYALIMDKRSSIDIDDQFDFDVAEALYKLSEGLG